MVQALETLRQAVEFGMSPGRAKIVAKQQDHREQNCKRLKSDPLTTHGCLSEKKAHRVPRSWSMVSAEARTSPLTCYAARPWCTGITSSLLIGIQNTAGHQCIVV